jgi:hypothetical protein
VRSARDAKECRRSREKQTSSGGTLDPPSRFQVTASLRASRVFSPKGKSGRRDQANRRLPIYVSFLNSSRQSALAQISMSLISSPDVSSNLRRGSISRWGWIFTGTRFTRSPDPTEARVSRSKAAACKPPREDVRGSTVSWVVRLCSPINEKYENPEPFDSSRTFPQRA